MLEIRDAHVRYDGHKALSGASCSIAPGEMLGIIGSNGSGKSTLGRLMCGALIADGDSVKVDGHDPAASQDEHDAVRRAVGWVQQNPVDQIVSTNAFDEVAFGLRNLGVDEDEVARRVDAALRDAGLAEYGDRETGSLSGGELQRLCIASALALKPRYLVLDEPTSQLDAGLRPRFRAMLSRLAHDRGVGIALITHDPLEVLSCDRVVVLRGGRVAWEGAPRDLLLGEPALWSGTVVESAYADALKALLELGIPCGACPGCPLPQELVGRLERALGARQVTLNDIEALLSALRKENVRTRGGRPVASSTDGLAMRDVSFSYGDAPVLVDSSLTVPQGSVTLLAGPSGSGKSTLAHVASGLLDADSGAVEIDGGPVAVGAVALAFQNPEGQFFLDTVEDEIAFGPRNRGLGEDEVARCVADASRACGLDAHLLERYPFALSGGQARRAAIASAVSLRASALILDEPTAGLDAPSRRALHRLVRELADGGRAVLIISHDIEEWLAIADRVALMSAGTVRWQGGVSELRDDSQAFRDAGMPAPWSWELEALLDRMLSSRTGRVDSPSGRESERVALLKRDEREGAVEKRGARTPLPFRPAPVGSERDAVDKVAERPRGRKGARTPSLLGRTSAAHSPASDLDARVKIILLLAVTVSVFAAPSPVTLAAWYLVLAAIFAIGRIDAASLLRACAPVGVILLFTVCANLVSCDGRAAIALVGPVGLNPVGGLRGVMAVLRIVLLLGFALAVSVMSSPQQLSDACVRLLRPLARIGVPVGAIGSALSIALRFIPVVGEEFVRIRLAQRARGVDFGEGGVIERVRVWTSVLTPLVVGLFRRADRLADAMSARCYAGAVTVARSPLDAKDWGVLAAGAVLAIAIPLLARLAA